MRWSQLLFIIAVAAVTVAALWFLVNYSNPAVSQPASVPASAGLKVAVSIPPLQSIVRSIGREKVSVVTLLPPGASPHTFEPKISELAKLPGAQVSFVIGHGLDDWTREMVADPATVLVVDSGIELRPNREADGAGAADPHYWLSFENTRQIARNMAAKLQELDPVNAEFYAANLAEYDREIISAEAASRKNFDGIRGKKIITFHDAWEYFAAEMGLEVVATFEPSAGKEPTPQYLEELQKTVRRYQVKTIFSEPQLSIETLNSFLADLGVNVRDLDPLGGSQPDVDFLETLTQNAQIISEASK